MPLVSGKVLLAQAYEHGYAVPAFNGNTLDHALAIVAAAEAEDAPVFLQCPKQNIAHHGLELGVLVLRAAAERARVPVAVHLDHGKSLAINAQALAAGCTSLMFDGSHLSYEENVRITHDIAAFAHPNGISVEAELGRVGLAEEGLTTGDVEKLYTDPEQAVEFASRTGCDSLAVACGSVHHGTAQTVELDLDRLAAIHKAVDIPLVLHGASGVTNESARGAVERGVAKINIATRFNRLFTAALRESTTQNADEGEPTIHLQYARHAMSDALRPVFALLGSKGQASTF